MEAETQEALTLQSPLFIRNLARDPESRTARRLRPGNKLGFLFDDGKRIRRAGARTTQIVAVDLAQNFEAVLDGVKHRYIEVTDSSGQVLGLQDLRQLVEGLEVKSAVSSELTQVNSTNSDVGEPESNEWSPYLKAAEEEPQVAREVSEQTEVHSSEDSTEKAAEAARNEAKTLNLGGRRKGR